MVLMHATICALVAGRLGTLRVLDLRSVSSVGTSDASMASAVGQQVVKAVYHGACKVGAGAEGG